MSKVKIQGHASGTGVLTVTAPNTSTDRTITLPDTTGTLLDENSSVPAANLTGTVADARFPATLPAASAANLTAIPAANITGTLPAINGAALTNLPSGGKILAVSSGTMTSSNNMNGTSPEYTGYSHSFTPSATSSKLWLNFHVPAMKNGTDMNCSMYLYRQIGGSGGYSAVAGKMIQSLDTGTSTWSNAIFKLQYLDSPNTTSQIDYRIYSSIGNGSGLMYLNSGGSTLSFTIMEVDGS